MSTILIPYLVDIAFFVGWAVTGLGSLYLGSVLVVFFIDRVLKKYDLMTHFLRFVMERRKKSESN